MNRNRKLVQAGAWMMMAGLSFAPGVRAMAAENSNSGNNRATIQALANGDIIDASRTGSLTIRKYDITGAENDGAYDRDTYTATGQADSRVEQALENYGIEGVTFSYLKVGNVETRNTTERGVSKVELIYEIPTDLATILGLSKNASVDGGDSCQATGIYHFTSQQISDALAGLLQADDVKAKNALENYLYDYGSADSAADHQLKKGAANMEKTDAHGYTTVSNLDLGLYLVVETEVPENVTATVNPWFVQLPFTNESVQLSADSEDTDGSGGEQWLYDMTCYPKNQTGNPTLDKGVRNHDDKKTYGSWATASEGDVLDYILVSKLPHISSSATYLTEYTFVDRLSEGLEYNGDVKIAFYHDAEDAAANREDAAELIWNLSGSEDSRYADATVAPLKEGQGNRLTVKLKNAGLDVVNGAKELGSFSDYYMVVSYTATMHSNDSVVLGDNGNPNDVQLLWSRTSEGYYDVLEDRNYVFTYALDLTKKFSDDQGDYGKVQFKLYNQAHNSYVTAETSEDGIYHVTGATKNETKATVFIPDTKGGTLQIRGMEADTYQLTEIATDSGYSLLRDPIVIEIESTEREVTPSSLTAGGKLGMLVGEVQPASASVDGVEVDMQASGDSAHAEVTLEITNSKNFRLPQTGGDGLYAVTILGVLTVAGGCYLVTRKKRA